MDFKIQMKIQMETNSHQMEPAHKKARFAASAPSSSSSSSSSPPPPPLAADPAVPAVAAPHTKPKQLHEDGEDYMCHANKAISLWFPSTLEELDKVLFYLDALKKQPAAAVPTNQLAAHPSYTHQMFGDDETIVGFKDLSINLVFSPATLHMHYAQIHSDRLIQIGQKPDKDELVDKLKLAFPDGWTRDAAEFRDFFGDELKSYVPLGERVLSYSVAGKQFVVHRTTPGEDEAARETHERTETMSMWYIDGATYCDLEDHRWAIYTVYEEHNIVADGVGNSNSQSKVGSHAYTFVGYMTTFNFTNPFRLEGLPKVAMRVCQVIIMPHSQRQGHGKRLLQLAHDEVLRRDMYELTVEDPNEAFCQMRDTMDLQNCLKAGFFDFGEKDTQIPLDFKLDDATLDRVHAKLRITKGQIRRCYEVLKLKALDVALSSIDGKAGSPGTSSELANTDRSSRVHEAVKAFRLEVKERLWRNHKAHLTKIEDKSQRLHALQLLWGEVSQSFRVSYANAFRR